jgi:hypothetical protein
MKDDVSRATSLLPSLLDPSQLDLDHTSSIRSDGAESYRNTLDTFSGTRPLEYARIPGPDLKRGNAFAGIAVF